MSDVLGQLEIYHRERSLISLRRDEIDDSSIQGFILGYSAELVLVQHVYDFHLDGIYVLNVSDITTIESGSTNKLHREILAEEGLLPERVFNCDYPLSCWSDLLHHLAESDSMVILEDEDPDDDIFLIGRVARVTDYEVHVHHFNGSAQWDADPSKLTFEYITCCQLSTNYLNKYQAYFERHPDHDLAPE